MNIKLLVGLGFICLALSAESAKAAIVLDGLYGQALSYAGVAVPDGTLWALIVDSNSSSTLPGGMSINSSLSASDPVAVLSAFSGKSVSIGASFGGDTVFAMGRFDSALSGGTLGITENAVLATLGTNGVASGRAFGFYFFPGVTYTVAGVYNVGNEVGGINTTAPDASMSTVGMTIPADGMTITPGATTHLEGVLEGSIPKAAFTAVLVPEPSTALLGILGSLGLLRRRR